MKNFLLSLLFLFTAPAFGQTWAHIGPYKQTGSLFQTGRTNVIRTHPLYNGTSNQTIYVGSVTGGFWKTTNDGTDWTNIHPDPAIVKYGGTSAIAITPDATTIYVGDMCFLYGSSGVYKYFPATDSWQATGSLPGATGLGLTIHDIRIHPADPQLVFACTTAGLYRSANGGTSWTQVINADIENVAFIPTSSGTSGAYAYFVYACGKNVFSKSVNDGVAFTAVPGMASLWTSFTLVHSDMNFTTGANTGEYHLYLFARIESASPIDVDYGDDLNTVCYGVYRYTYNDITSSESSAKVILYRSTTYAEDYQTDRLTVAGYQNVVYFGGTGIWKYNLNTNQLYLPSTATDVVTTSIGYTSGGILHPDMHDALILPALNKLFVATDGGIYRDNYTSGAQQVFTNSWAEKNNGLHISQIKSFSGSEEDPDIFVNNDGDNSSMYINDESGTFRTTYSNEAPSSLMDKYDQDRIWYRTTAYDPHVAYTENMGVSVSLLQTQWTFGTATDFCEPNGTWSWGANEFNLKTMFQDPNRPDHVYYNNATLGEFCFSRKEFVPKYRPGVHFASDPDPTVQMEWNQIINGMAFSRLSKNDVYITAKNAGAAYSQILKYSGSDIDNSWVGNNENQWTRITPNIAALLPGSSPVNPQKVWYPAIAASDWTANTIWAACSAWNDYPATDMPIKVLKYSSGVWSDMSTGIPLDESPTALIYEQGSNDQLYLGTNRSVYYYDKVLGTWIDISEGEMPHIKVTELQINYSENTLRVGLTGRGVWKRSLICPNTNNINLTGTYSANAFYEAANIISASAYNQLTSDVKMRAANYIDILPGAGYSEVNGTSVNTLFAYIHSCESAGNTWRKLDNNEPVFSTPEDIEAAMEPDGFSLYPNPSGGHFVIAKPETEEAATAVIYDLYGRRVGDVVVLKNEKTDIDLAGQPTGIYLVRITTANKTQTLRLIKQ
jgi:hypothetical protein